MTNNSRLRPARPSGATCVLLGLALLLPSERPAEPADIEAAPAPIERRPRIRLDLTVDGPAEIASHLTADDLKIEVGGRELTALLVDPICNEAGPGTGGPDEATYPQTFPTNFVFYLQGKQRSDEDGVPVRARELVKRLVTGHNRGMIVYDRAGLTTVAELTDDTDRLIHALENLPEPLASESPLVVGRDRSAQRMTLFMGLLSTVESPKVLIHLGPKTRYSTAESGREIVRAANEQGVRIYHYPSGGVLVRYGGAGAVHFDIARPTGGKSFSDTDPADKIVGRITEDLRCFCMVTAVAEALAEDVPHEVFVASRNPKLSVSTRHQTVIQSEERRLTSRLMGAFAAPEAVRSGVEVLGAVIPLGRERADDGSATGRYQALAQVAIGGSSVAHTSWQVGATLFSSEPTRQVISLDLTVESSNVPLVVERTISLAPGPFELVIVARETNELYRGAGLLGATQLSGEWHEPSKSGVAISPPVVLQSRAAMFVRDGLTRPRGSLAALRHVDPARSTALLSIVCAGRKAPRRLRIDRELIRDDTVPFEPMEIDVVDDPCVMVQDVVPENSMSPGDYRYAIRVSADDLELATFERRLPVGER